MSPDDPRHGTKAGSVAHWKAGELPCGPCREAANRLTKAARIDRERGRPRTTTLGDRAHHIIQAVPADQLARATGLTVHKLSRLRAAGPDAVVHARTQAKILTAGAAHYWTPIGIQRRVQALAAMGWSARTLAPQVGVGYEAIKRLARATDRAFVRRDIAQAVITAYDRLSMTPITSGSGAVRAANAARRAGWPPPLAWDDIDNPDERPTRWEYRAPDRREAVLDFTEHGLNATQAARRLHTSREALEVWCRRNGLTQQYRRMAAREALGNNQWTREESA